MTGATGHLGGAVIKELQKSDYTIRVLIHENAGDLSNRNLENYKGDILDKDSLRNPLRGADGVIHLAAKISIMGDPNGIVERTNVLGVKNIAEMALESGVKRFVHISSIHAFNTHISGDVIDEFTPRVDRTAPKYDQSKNKGEIELRKIMAKGLDAIIFHPTAVIGPYDFMPSRMGKVFLDLVEGKMPALISGGFDFVDSRDVAEIAVKGLTQGRCGENYITSGRYLTVRELAILAGNITGVNPPKFNVPLWLAKLVAPIAEQVVTITKSEPLFTRESLNALSANRVISHKKAFQDFGYHPRDIRESIFDIYDFFYRRGVIKQKPLPEKAVQEGA